MGRKYKIKIFCNPRQLKRIMELQGIRVDEKDIPKFDEALISSSSISWECECTEECIEQFIEIYFNKKSPAGRQEIDYSWLALISSLVLLVMSIVRFVYVTFGC